MKRFHTVLAAAAIAFSLSCAGAAGAQTHADHGTAGMAAAPGMTAGEVRKIDKENGKITLKHAEIKHLDMAPMTMVFVAKDKALLDTVQVGQKVQFIAVHEGGKMTVTDIQPVK